MAFSNSSFNFGMSSLVMARASATRRSLEAFAGIPKTPLEDIDRIEVIRGPGAIVWGANAVNEVINIIIKKTTEAKGGLVTGGGGTQELGFG
jgi:iron complex outermembrane receptor protein